MQALDRIRRTTERLTLLADRNDPSHAVDLEPALTDLQQAIDELRDELKSIRDFSILVP